MHHAAKSSLEALPESGTAHWRSGFAMAAYGPWMVFAVLARDRAVALAIGSAALRQRFARALPMLERLSGVMLIVLAVRLRQAAGSR